MFLKKHALLIVSVLLLAIIGGVTALNVTYTKIDICDSLPDGFSEFYLDGDDEVLEERVTALLLMLLLEDGTVSISSRFDGDSIESMYLVQDEFLYQTSPRDESYGLVEYNTNILVGALEEAFTAEQSTFITFLVADGTVSHLWSITRGEDRSIIYSQELEVQGTPRIIRQIHFASELGSDSITYTDSYSPFYIGRPWDGFRTFWRGSKFNYSTMDHRTVSCGI